MFKKATLTQNLLLLVLLAFTVPNTDASCSNNEKRPENQAACDGQYWGAMVAYPGDCSKFLVCVPCTYPTVRQCYYGFLWDDKNKFCNLPQLVDCDANVGETSSTTEVGTVTPTMPTSTTAAGDTTKTTKGLVCNNEQRPENKVACAGQRWGEVVSYPGDCSKMLVCTPCEYPVVESCPNGLWWDNTYKFCNLPILVDCDNSAGTTLPTDQTTSDGVTTTTDSGNGICNNERRPENKAACAGQRWGAVVSYPGDCSKFLVCTPLCEYPEVANCPNDLWWDNTHKICNIPILVDCDSSTETTTPTTTTDSGNGICNNVQRPENKAACAGQRFGALVAYPGDCSKFLICTRICEYPEVGNCPAGLWWDNSHKFCDIPLLVDCDNSSGTTLPTDQTTSDGVTTPTITTDSGNGICNNERRPENKAACAGQRWGALVAYPGDCSKFLICTRICEYPEVGNCPAGLWWDNSHKFCDIPLLVDCDSSTVTTLPTDQTTSDVVTIPTTTTDSGEGMCNNERRPENKAACAGQRWGAVVAYPGDCSKFLMCTLICEYPKVGNCHYGLLWDDTYKLCNLPQLVECDNTEETTTEITTPIYNYTSPQSTTNESNACIAPVGMSADICLNHKNGVLLSYPYNCNAYIKCTMGCPVMNYCQADKVFNMALQICDTPGSAHCEELTMTTTTPYTTTAAYTTTTTSSAVLSPSEKCADQEVGTSFSYEQNCQRYIYCNGNGGFLILNCPYGTYYHFEKGNCLAGDDSEVCLH